jgi:hypothetical protein
MIIAITYPKAGSLAGTLGALGGLLCIYILPTVTFISQTQKEILHPSLIKALRTNEYTLVSP